jgi:hypothetical protein
MEIRNFRRLQQVFVRDFQGHEKVVSRENDVRDTE